MVASAPSLLPFLTKTKKANNQTTNKTKITEKVTEYDIDSEVANMYGRVEFYVLWRFRKSYGKIYRGKSKGRGE